MQRMSGGEDRPRERNYDWTRQSDYQELFKDIVNGIVVIIPVHSTLYNKVATRMLNSQSLSYNQKVKLWKEQKEDKFKEIAMDKSSLFNYFYTNNDLFKFIDEEDFLIYS